MRKNAVVIFGLSLGVALGSGIWAGPMSASPAFAQTYSQWSDPKAPTASVADKSGKLDELIKRLKAKVREAEKARAADPRFLKDLRALAREFETPWARRLVFDDFRDGDFTENPQWRVAQGRFWIERGQGLRCVAEAPPEPTAKKEEEAPKKLTREDKAALILGALLGGSSSTDSDQSDAQAEPEPVPQDAIIHTRRTVTNAFALSVRLSSWVGDGQLEVGVFQERNRNAGYRIAYSPNQRIELLRVGSRGVRVIDTSNSTVELENNKTHTLDLQRYPGGRTVVWVDGKKLIDVIDKTFKDQFDGVIIVNRGGDYTFHQISVDGTQ